MQEEIKYEKDGLNLRVVVQTATTLMGVTRNILEQTANDTAKKIVDFTNMTQVAERLSITLMYPGLISCVKEHDGFETWPPSYDQFLALPDVFVGEWEKKAMKLNPHWRANVSLTEAQKKIDNLKVTSSTQS